MSGLVGYSVGSGTKAELCKALSILEASDLVTTDPIFEDALIHCGRAHLGIVGETSSPITLGQLSIWLIGEFYNIEILRSTYKLSSKSEGELLLEAYQTRQLQSVLAEVDGYFCAVIYDRESRLLHFITDRFGIQPLYLWVKGNQLIWATSLKCFLEFKVFSPKIHDPSVDRFLSHGYIMGRGTWFAEVELLPASAVCSFSLVDLKKINEYRYWSWKNISRTSIPFADASAEIARLFRKAVNTRVSKPYKYLTSLSLSGGLDSRAILAAIDKSTVGAFTFGLEYSDDVRIARQVAQKMGVKHRLFDLSYENWWNHRVEELWQADGSVSLLHLHVGQFHQQIGILGQICLNGFAGDLILGGSFLRTFDQRNQEALELSLSNLYPEIDPNDPFLDLKNQDSFHIEGRVRRFTAYGINGTRYFKYRLPFMDNELIEFVYSLPDAYRWQQKIYKHLLLQNFPALFRNTRTTGTLAPISAVPDWPLTSFFKSSINRIKKKVRRSSSAFADYNHWIQKDLYFYKGVLEHPENILSEVLGKKLTHFLDGSTFNYELFMRLVSMEIWFQQVYNGKYLTTEETLPLKSARI